jgi:hypothetical protein
MVKVKNLNGTSDKQPKGYDTWLEFWEGKTGKTADHCGATDCNVKGRSNLVGAHVKKVGAGDDSHYITPLCKGCNQRTDEFYVDTELVHAESR